MGTVDENLVACVEVFASPEFYVLRDGQNTLWCPRCTSNDEVKLIPKTGASLPDDLKCIGSTHGLVGLFNSDKLVLIKRRQLVGRLPDHGQRNKEAYKVKAITVIFLNGELDQELALEPCPTHQPHLIQSNQRAAELNLTNLTSPAGHHGSNLSQPTAVQKTWTSIKNASSHVTPSRVMGRATGSGSQPVTGSIGDPKERFERRLVEELIKMFNDTDSFYYCPDGGDLTNSMQRLYSVPKTVNASLPVWQRLHERFFWNRFMVKDLIQLADSGHKSAGHWVTPIIQGFVQIERCSIDVDSVLTPTGQPPGDKTAANGSNRQEYMMIVISRRSRHRAGTRYKRRGVDDQGHTANYVETEQIFRFNEHVVSCVQVRGSVPIYWSQPGYAYRPPPRLDRPEEESQKAFELHFDKEFEVYGSEAIVNLVERSGRERVIGDAYLNHVINFDSEKLTYISFDFHEYCRGMKFENVAVLIESMKDVIKESRFCWIDAQGMICSQVGTFRVNCIDCLDRTNVVQTAIARTIMDFQFTRLGLLPPEGLLPHSCRRIFQMMWANNGDTISRQYAGTAALKGDFTRTGERKITGALKDSYNSASRYYQNRFKDAYRQATIDVMLGVPVTDADLNSPESEDAAEVLADDDSERHERVKSVIEDCKKILIPDHEVILGGWPLIDADPATGPSNPSNEMDIVLILTKESYFVAEYDDQTDRIVRYQRVLLEDLEKIEFGSEPGATFLSGGRVRLGRRPQQMSHCVRFHYVVHGTSGYFHMFKPTDTRFFNNMAIPIRTPEEEVESLKAICESFKVALSVKCLNVPFFEGKLEKRKSKVLTLMASGHVQNQRHRSQGRRPQSESTTLPRNVSDGNLLSLKSVGSKAFTGMSSQLARFKGKLAAKVAVPSSLSTLREPTESGSTLDSSSGAASSSAVHFDVETDDDEYTDAEESSFRGSRFLRDQSSIASSSVFAHDDRSGSDYSECSELGDDAATPMVEHEPMSKRVAEETTRTLDVTSDTILASCGILTTSPPLGNFLDTNVDIDGVASHRSVLVDLDDFVLDAIKKASLRHIQRLASDSSSKSAASDGPVIRIQDISSQGHLAGANQAYGSMPTLAKDKTTAMSRSSEGVDMGPSPRPQHSQQWNLCDSAMSSASCAALAPICQVTLPDSGGHFEADGGHCSLDYGLANSGQGSNLLSVSKMKNSHSETAIQDSFSSLSASSSNLLSNNHHHHQVPTSPMNVKRDFVLSPLSRIAKGVQNFGLRAAGHLPAAHRKSNPNMLEPEAYETLKLRKRQCKSRIIEL